jgi:hypothetical protein
MKIFIMLGFMLASLPGFATSYTCTLFSTVDDPNRGTIPLEITAKGEITEYFQEVSISSEDRRFIGAVTFNSFEGDATPMLLVDSLIVDKTTKQNAASSMRLMADEFINLSLKTSDGSLVSLICDIRI